MSGVKKNGGLPFVSRGNSRIPFRSQQRLETLQQGLSISPPPPLLAQRISPVLGREQKVVSPPPHLDCICNRPYSTVFCGICGWIGSGRVRTTCSIHPRTLYLYDFVQCPRCKSYSPFIQEKKLN